MGKSFAEGGSGGFDPSQIVPGTGMTVDELQRTGDYSRSDLSKMVARTTMGPRAVGALGDMAGNIGKGLQTMGQQPRPAAPVQFQAPPMQQFQAPDASYLSPRIDPRAFFGG
jgi:hypothetical protein